MLPREQWFDGYINPFQLLNVPSSVSLSDIDAKLVPETEEGLLQEIDLEEGRVHWVPDMHIDRSRAIGASDDLNSEENPMFHWAVFSDKLLLDFLNRGSHHHFLVDERKSPLETIEVVWGSGDADFQAWLSLLHHNSIECSRAISSRNAVITECFWMGGAGSRPVGQTAASRIPNALSIGSYNRCETQGKAPVPVPPTIPRLKRLQDDSKVVEFLSLLPMFSESLQSEAVCLVRGIAVTTYNEHGDIDVSRKVGDYSHQFKFRSADANRQIEADVKVYRRSDQKEKTPRAKPLKRQ